MRTAGRRRMALQYSSSHHPHRSQRPRRHHQLAPRDTLLRGVGPHRAARRPSQWERPWRTSKVDRKQCQQSLMCLRNGIISNARVC